MLKPYMGYSRSEGSLEGAVLIFAHNLKEAKRIGAATYNKHHPGHSLAAWRKKHGETHHKLWSGKAAK